MFEFLIHHKKTIMTYTLWLIIPSFIVMYGVGQCSVPPQHRWVAKVNGEKIYESQWRNRMDQIRGQEQTDLDDEYVRQQALATEIIFEIFRQKSDEWSLATTDGEIKAHIVNNPNFQDENGNFIGNQQYTQLLYQNGVHPIVYEENVRMQLTQDKVRTVAQNAFANAKPDQTRSEQQRKSKAEIEFLAFQPSAYTDEVEVDDEGMQAYFEENQEDYRVPQQRKITYVQFKPSEYRSKVNELISDATTFQRLLERYFEENRQNYEIPEQVRVERLTYSAEQLKNAVSVTDDELKDYYEANKSKYQTGERVKVRYIKEPLAAIAETQDVTEGAIEDYYEKNKFRYEHDDQVKARHILIKVRNNAPASELAAAKEKIEAIKEEIINGLPFEEAAKKYSEDTGSALKGGDLGYFGRGRMVPEFEESAFSLPLGQVSPPVKTDFGYHIIKVEDRKEAGTDSLEEVRDEIADTLKKQKAVAEYRQKAKEIDSLNATGKEVQETGWIKRGEPIPNIPETDRLYFSSSAFMNLPGTDIKFSGNNLTENLYLIETVERQESQPLPLEEAKDDVEEDLRLEKAEDVARQAAEADIVRIKSASVPLETIAEERDLQLVTSQLFGRGDQFVQGFGPNPTQIINSAMTMETGEVDGPFQTATGYHIIRLLAREPAHLPELEEVESQVNQAFIAQRAKEMARTAANTFADRVYADQVALSEGAENSGFESQTTGFFSQNDPIPGIGRKPELTSAAFEMDEGDISVAIETLQGFAQPGIQDPPVDSYFIIQLDEIKETYLPELAEVREDVERDYKLVLAEDIAIEKAKETLEKIKQAVENAEPVSATRTIELKEFADIDEQNTAGDKVKYNQPFEITGNGQIPGAQRSLALAKTAFALQPSEISGLVYTYSKKINDEGKLVNDKLTGVYIAQVLGKPDPEEEDPSDQRQISDAQIARFMEQAAQRYAFSAWIDEVSATARIEYQMDIIKPDDTDDIQQTENTLES